MRLKVKFF